MRANMVWLVCGVLIAGIICLFVFRKSDLTDDQQADLNFLDSTIFDFAHPTPQNETMRFIACENYEKQAVRYLKLNSFGISDRVKQYTAYCAKLHGEKP